jgi:ketosteroid isomerase-like protein
MFTKPKERKVTRQIALASLLALVSIVMVIPCAAQQSTAEKEILVLEDKMNAIYAANDLPNYFKYYADDFTQWLPEGRTDLPQYKKQWTTFIQGGGRIESNQISDMHVQIDPAGDTAVASYLAQVKTRSQNGKVSDETFHETDVWFQRDGTWKIVHLHYSPAPKKK